MQDSEYVVSFADGAGHYIKAMGRLELSLSQVGFKGQVRMHNDYAHIGSPMHKGPKEYNPVPYAFKAFAIKKAMDEGARYILWCDSVVYATKSLGRLFYHIRGYGYILFDNIGFSIGDYTSDQCLLKHGMSREEAFDSKMIMACVMGFDTHDKTAREFLERYISSATDGVSYHGDWTNEMLQVSNDMRVKGHRHDQSVASIIAKQMGMTITRAQDTFFAYASHKGIVPIADSVCLWSEGI